MARARRGGGGGNGSGGGSAARRNRARREAYYNDNDDEDDDDEDDGEGFMEVPPEILEALYTELQRRQRWRPRMAGDPPEPLFTLLQWAAALLEAVREAAAAAAAWLRLDEVPFGGGGDSSGGGASGGAPGGAGPSQQGGPEAASGDASGSGNPVASAFARLGLGDGAEATAEGVRSAFRRLSLSCHPDKCAGDADAPARFAALAAARDVALKHLAGAQSDDEGDDDAERRADAAAEAAEAATPRARATRRAAAAEARRAEVAALRAEEARIAEAERTAARAAAARADTPAFRDRRRAWEARVRAMDAELKDADDAARRASYGSRKQRRSRPPPDAPQVAMQRRAAAEEYVGRPPAPPPPASPADAFASCADGIAVAIRARAPRHLYSLLQVFAMQGQLREVLTANLGAGTRALHHAAAADWAEGVDLIISFAGANYAQLILAKDDTGCTPADVAAARCEGDVSGVGDASGVAARLRELETHAAASAAAAAAAEARALRDIAARVGLGLLKAPLRLTLLTGRIAYALVRRMLGL
jgi:curved DNA-binding protein CbpA